ncbi:serine/threonine-protein kinase OSR1-like isoform X2 [Hibiscus syriacus]|uniref:Serine/threonine-protein kinase OSR1-like isoform X2 n=1 Tax=Hibiscus syriacus TaxID=106335 RepID=A0A6A2XXW7_HIBSY|nr:serine/threonine-protein kinase OSR1-like isoform X2 [Hibiscus syriacus]
MLAQKKMPDGEKEELSQNEYKRGISGWNFNLEDMKAQASLIHDDDLISDASQGGSSNSLLSLEGRDKQSECQTSSQATGKENSDLVQNQPASSAAIDPAVTITKFERSDDDSSGASASHELNVTSHANDDCVESKLGEKPVLELNGKSSDNMIKHLHQRTATIPGSITIPETIVLPVKGESDKQNQHQNISGGNGAAVPAGGEDTLSELPCKASKSPGKLTSDEEKAKPPVVQQKGRFKVTSENVGLEKVTASPLLQKSRSMQVLTTNPPTSLAATSDPSSSIPAANHLFPLLQSVLQTNILQREYILNVMKQACAGDPIANRAFEGVGVPANVRVTEKSLLELAHDREKELLHEITELQWRLICTQEELQKYKTENGQVSF